jgi:anthranilate phosphoribosyltransferase
MEKILSKIKKKENLTFEESKIAFNSIMVGQVDESKIFE